MKGYKFVVLILVFIGSFNGKLFADIPILVRQMEVVRNDSVFLHHFIYNESDEKTVDTEYFKENDNLIRQNQTEWIYSNNQCTEQRVRKWINNNWKELFVISFNYVNGKKSDEIRIDVSNGTEQFVSKTKFTYSENNLISKINFQWINNIWVKVQEISYEYTSDNLPQTTTFFIYENGIIDSKRKIEYGYSDTQQLLTTTNSLYQNDEWQNQQQTVFYYDTLNNRKILEVSKIWDSKYSVWVNQQNIQYKYDQNQNLIETDYQFWTGLFWKNDVKYKYQYNNEQQLVTKESYLPIYNDYRLISQVNYTDFLHGKASLIKSKNLFWGGETNSPRNTFIPFQFNDVMSVESGSEIKISYTPFENTGILTFEVRKQNNIINVYPNPSKGVFYFNSNDFQVYRWVVTDMNGKILLENRNLNNSQIIDLSDFKKGIYLLKVSTSEGVKMQKLIKI